MFLYHNHLLKARQKTRRFHLRSQVTLNLEEHQSSPLAEEVTQSVTRIQLCCLCCLGNDAPYPERETLWSTQERSMAFQSNSTPTPGFCGTCAIPF